jgi:hypothetical protein
MKIREIAPDNYLDKITKKLSTTMKTGAPLPQNVLPKGPIKTNATVKSTVNKMNTTTNKNLLKPGQQLPIPTAPGKEQDMEIVSVGPQDIKMKSNDPKKPGEFTVTKKELDPVISNVLQRSRGQAQR